jgi:hypothetical protein
MDSVERAVRAVANRLIEAHKDTDKEAKILTIA